MAHLLPMCIPRAVSSVNLYNIPRFSGHNALKGTGTYCTAYSSAEGRNLRRHFSVHVNRTIFMFWIAGR
jgi:hypothetical protein